MYKIYCLLNHHELRFTTQTHSRYGSILRLTARSTSIRKTQLLLGGASPTLGRLQTERLHSIQKKADSELTIGGSERNSVETMESVKNHAVAYAASTNLWPGTAGER